ncbi:hypothetical protein [Microbacterium hibisci]|uniref:hypothetical protein n=1 Tax=Microbacterium hibisci TaxID=2036000 RepID=UPI001943A625|nr:hypothetical protein [Microbacterium hibisci]
MGMAEEARQAISARAAARQKFDQARAKSRERWLVDVDLCAAEFAQAAPDLGVKPDAGGFLRQPRWVLWVDVEQPDGDSYRAITQISVHSSGAWNFIGSFDLSDYPKDGYSPTLADYASIRKRFVERLHRR